jgi:hypothetical protein
MLPLLLPLQPMLSMPMLVPLMLPLPLLGVEVGVKEMVVEAVGMEMVVEAPETPDPVQMVVLQVAPILVTQVGLEPRFSMGVGL